MNIESIEKLMELSMMDAIADLKNGKEFDMQFYFFFRDGYCKLPLIPLEKQVVYGVINLLLTNFKPEAFSMISDCFVRDIHGNLTHEQLLSMVVEKTGESRTLARPYDRSKNGDIILRENEDDMKLDYVGGMLPSLYTNSPIIIAESSQKLLIESFKQVFEHEKVIYERSPFSSVSIAKTKKPQDDNGNDGGMTLH